MKNSANLAKTKPFLKWAGGKRQLLPMIDKYILQDSFSTFYEPFVGAGAVFLHYQPENLVINDYNSELITTYNVIKDDVNALITKLEELTLKNNKEDFLKIRAWDVDGKLKNSSDVDRAARMIYLNKTCFNGMYRVNRFGNFNVPFANNKNPKILDEDNLKAVNTYLNKANVKILNGDYKEALKSCKKGDFIYLDPPYASNDDNGFVAYTDAGFSNKEQEELRDILVDLDQKGCFWLYSNASVPIVHKLFEAYEETTFIAYASRNINSNGKGRGKVPEVLITNYTSFEGESKTLFDL